MLLPDTGSKGAWLVAERLRAAIADLSLPEGTTITASVGVACAPAHAPSAGALPTSLAGARLFVVLPPGLVMRAMGAVLLALVAFRHSEPGRRPVAEWILVPAGLVVGFLSAIAGSSGPLAATVFLGLRLPAPAFVATEAAATVLVHLSKSLVFGRLAVLSRAELIAGLVLGVAMVAGSWTGRKVLERVSPRRLVLLVEALLVVAGLLLLFHPSAAAQEPRRKNLTDFSARGGWGLGSKSQPPNHGKIN